MPRRRDYNAVMRPKRHSAKLNVSLIFSQDPPERNRKSDSDLSDALSVYSQQSTVRTDSALSVYSQQSTVRTDSLLSGMSITSSPTMSPTSPSDSAFSYAYTDTSEPLTPITPITPEPSTPCTPITPEPSTPYTPYTPRQITPEPTDPYTAITPEATTPYRTITPEPTTPTNSSTEDSDFRDNQAPDCGSMRPQRPSRTSRSSTSDPLSRTVMTPQKHDNVQPNPESPFSKLRINNTSFMKKKRASRASVETSVMVPQRVSTTAAPPLPARVPFTAPSRPAFAPSSPKEVMSRIPSTRRRNRPVSSISTASTLSVDSDVSRESLQDSEKENHQHIRRDSKLIYGDFEEMEALLTEKEALAVELERERTEKLELELVRDQQEIKQTEMSEKIQSIEQEIINVDYELLRMKADDPESLTDQKRSLQARLIMERGRKKEHDDLISVSGMSIYSENGLMLNQDITDLSKRELLDKLRTIRREKSEYEKTVKQLRCDNVNERRKQEKVIKDLMAQIRGFHMPVQRTESGQETMALIADLKTQLEQLKSQNKSQTKLIERLVTERNHHLIEIVRLKGNMEDSLHLKEEVS